MILFNRIILSVTLVISGVAQAQSVDSLFIRKLADEILLRSNAYENLRVLTKSIGPRLAGSSGMVKAEKWGLAAMQAAGADKAWMQECMVPHWVRGGVDKASTMVNLGDGKRGISLDVVALGNSMGSGPKGVTAEVLEVKSFEELELKREQVKGKIVFYNYRMDPRYINTFQAYGDAGAYRGQGPSRAAALGAVGVIVRTLSPVLDDNPHTGATRYEDGKPKIPAVAISTNGAVELSKLIAEGKVKSIYVKTNCKMLEDAPSFNVVGELRGTEYPDEIITVGGHLDSWDLAEGAHDDGTGCVQSIEVLRAMKALGIQPKRTIRAVMFMNEENGLRGGSKYAELAKQENKKFIMGLESDAGGFTPRGFGYSASEAQSAKIEKWQPLFKQYGALEFTKGGGGADIGPLRSLGTALIGLNPDSQRYMDLHHAKTDVFEAVSERELNLGAVVMTAMVYLVSKYGL